MKELAKGWSRSNRQIPLICLSHLRWDFVYQRPQHLLSRCVRERPVYFLEEPIFGEGPARMHSSLRDGGIRVVVPHLPHGMEGGAVEATLRTLMDRFLAEHGLSRYLLWYYTPMALGFTAHLTPEAVIYDCMDELSLFKGAPPVLRDRELELFRRADLVFTGGQSLYEAKRQQHPHVHAFPSSVDVAHFARARDPLPEPADQAGIPHPRLGFFGVIDERMDIDLVDQVAAARPGWHIILLGPVVKIDPASLPGRPNLHYPGGKSYQELPGYIASWDVALLPFARNESTRFISPTKTPEYLAAGRPVVSTSIRDVVRPYGEQKLVHIADDPQDFVAAIEAALAEDADARMRRADALLARTSWDMTWGKMSALIEGVVQGRQAASGARAGLGRGAEAGETGRGGAEAHGSVQVDPGRAAAAGQAG